MADIELVIKIPENTYRQIQALVRNGYFEHDICGNSMRRIAKGTPLPRGHGTLKDVDNIKTAFPSGEYVRTESVRATIDHEETIIEADNTESEKWVNFADDLIPIIDEAESKE